MRKLTRNNSDLAKQRARELRKASSISEEVFWQFLRKRTEFKFRRQYPAGPYFLDFYCREASLAIELDGEQHNERQDYDARRDEWLRLQGIHVVRIPTLDVFDPNGIALTRWLRVIESLCAERSARPSPPSPPLP